ncbi:hypothetical protein QEG23_000713 [Stenotrophomonas maltophilia]|uniref:Uncharacterized protein n=1 Tax=Stenotrophomonas maltophilia TaxID=40324 RepID=A0AAI9BZ80_STEMA|nr:hypothetical protein [Stenotrophomonas maltophilia]
MTARIPADLAELALAVADATVRADIELFARQQDIEGLMFYDLSCADDPRSPEAMGYIQRAAAYIEARGDVFPWRLVRHISAPTLVCFRDKETAHGQA